MTIGSQPLTYAPTLPKPASDANASTGPGIGEQINKALNEVNDLQRTADQMIEQVAAGNVEDTHKAVIAMEQAMMAMNLTLQVRNKVLDAYQEIMRTQI